jgi:hypothetical protein
MENVHPYELAGVFLDLVRGYDVPIGTVVVLSSLSHLARVGTAAYAADFVRALGRIQVAYGRGVRVVFPLAVGGLGDESTIRGLREIECWLAEVDRRRQYSLPRTSAHFTSIFLHTDNNPSTSGAIRIALRLPSLHSVNSCAFVSPGWEDLPRSLPTLGEEDEQGERLLPCKGKDGRYHALGKLSVIGKETIRGYFMQLQPIFKACKDNKVIFVTPLPR